MLILSKAKQNKKIKEKKGYKSNKKMKIKKANKEPLWLLNY